MIRQRAVKFLYVLSRVSNSDESRGFRKELHLADSEARRNGIRDFIIPLAIDDLPSSEYNVYLALRQAIDFRAGWSHGLFTLLQKLQKDRVSKRPKRFNGAAVTAWWQQYRSAVGGMRRRPDEYLSNWFPIQRMPARLYLHALADTRAGSPMLDLDFPYPGFWHDEAFVTFAPATECEGRLGSSITITGTDAVAIDCIHSNSLAGHSIDATKGRTCLSVYSRRPGIYGSRRIRLWAASKWLIMSAPRFS